MAAPGTVTISMAGSTAPPPPAGGVPPPRALTLFGKNVPCPPHKTLAMGTFALGLATAVIALVALIGLFATFNWLAFVIALYLIIVGLLLALSALKNSTYIATYFGFMRYPFGTGSLMIMTGAMTTGISSAGTIVGSITIAWGVIAVLCHLWLRGHNAAFNVPLTNR